MTVILRRSCDIPNKEQIDFYCATIEVSIIPPITIAKLPDAPSRLEAAFDSIRDYWWKLGKEIGKTPTAEWAHMPTCGTYASDFGVIMAWVRLVKELTQEKNIILVLCDDPWLFHYLATLDNVKAGKPPSLIYKLLKLRLRGFFARARLVTRVFQETLRARHFGHPIDHSGPVLMVFGHPDSRSDGYDVYFGDIMKKFPETLRMMHTDCAVARAKELAKDNRTASLHAWGQLKWLPSLLFTRWRPTSKERNSEDGLLIQRAAETEGSGGSAAMNRWHMMCQDAWLKDCKPSCVSWPWENHPWERALTRSAKALNIHTIGFQHTVIGPHMFGQSPASNSDEFYSIPDQIICNGPAYRNQLADWGIPEDQLSIGGNLRLAEPQKLQYDPDGPIFIALPGHHRFSNEMMEAVYSLGDQGRIFLFKTHPMYNYPFKETVSVKRTRVPLQELPPISAVVHCLGTVGLEALLNGMPTLRFRPRGDIAMNILPPNLASVAVDFDTLGQALENLSKPNIPLLDEILSPFNYDAWEAAFNHGNKRKVAPQ